MSASPADAPSLQDRFAPHLACFGCGPRNEKGLRIKSHPEGEQVVARWRPEVHHEAYPGMVNGGILGALLDCHMNWAAAWHLMQSTGSEQLPCTVTADYHVKLKHPTPSDAELLITAWTASSEPDRATIEASIEAEGVVTVTCSGLFVAVKEGHPAYRRW